MIIKESYFDNMVNMVFMIYISGVAASQEQDFGTANLHMEVSDIISVLVYVGVAKGNGVLSKTGKPEARSPHSCQKPVCLLGQP